MGYMVSFFIGGLLSCIIITALSCKGRSEREWEIYQKGYEEGRADKSFGCKEGGIV